MSTKNDHLVARTSPLKAGDVAPEFVLLDQDRKEWRLSEAVKKGDVVLSFVPLAFTGVCSLEMGCISKDAATWGAKGASVVGVDCDSFAANKAWAEKEGYSQRLLGDMHRQVCRAYGIYWAELNVTQRATVVIGKNTDGVGKIKFFEAREPGKAMDWERVLGMV